MFKKSIMRIKETINVLKKKKFILTAKKCVHIKTGNTYYCFGEIINKTSGLCDGQDMVLYTDCEKIYVRELHEFVSKFKFEGEE